MKRLLVIAGSLIIVGIAAFATLMVQHRTEFKRVSGCLDEMQYDFVDVGSWRTDGLDVITTPAEVVGVLGEPDDIRKGDGNRLADFYRYPQIGTVYKVWNDSVAILSELSFEFGAPALALGDRRFDGNTTLKELKGLYRASYACRNVPFDPSGWSGGAYDTSIEMIDTLHWDIAPQGVRVELLFKQGKLKVISM